MEKPVLEGDLRDFLEELCAESGAPDPLGVLGPLFAALKRQFPFSSGLFFRIDPLHWTATLPYVHQMSAEAVREYLEHY